MKKRLLIAAVIILAWLAYFAWQRQNIDAITLESASTNGSP